MKTKTVVVISIIILIGMLASVVVAIILKNHIIAVYGWATAATLMFALSIFSDNRQNKNGIERKTRRGLEKK